MKSNFSKSARGISIIEMVVYIGLVGAIATFILNFLMYSVDVYRRALVDREILSNARLVLENVNRAVGESREVYAPTSVFFSDAGQLALITTAGAMPAGHTSAYADYWVDNGVMYEKREGAAASAISAASVRITKFRVEWIMQGLNRESVKITLQVDASSGKYPSSVTLNSTTALRGRY